MSKKPDKVWIGDPPSACDLCDVPITQTFYDCSIPGASWANVCPRCFIAVGASLGIGRGQHYRKQEDGRFHCIAGGS